jgi:uncharacterized protein with von Willebrand factor type A (vWA) domain
MQITVANGYLPPSDSAIQAAASQANLKLKIPDFVRDVCNIAAGGHFLSPEEINNKIQDEWDRTSIKREFVNKKTKFVRSDNNKSYNNFAEARNSFYQDKERLAQKIQNTINSMDRIGVPGNTPLEQSVNLINLLIQQRYGASVDPEAAAQKFGTDNVLDDVLDCANVSLAEDNLETAKNMSQDEQDLLDQIAEIKEKKENRTQSSSGFGGRGVGDGTLTGFTAKSKNILRHAMHLADNQMAEILQVSRKMKAFSKLRTSKVQEFTPDAEGNQVRNRGMQHYGELPRIKAAQYAQKVVTPNLFNYRSVTNQFMIRERGRFLEKKQLLYVLVDCSGSMTDDGSTRINMAAGILVNRLMAVAKGDANVYWRFFDTMAHDVTFVDDKAQAQESISKIIDSEHYAGGGTNFDTAISTAVEHIESLKETMKFAKPEIFIVTDGGCSCSLKRDDLKGIKLHAGIVANEHPSQLHALVGATGGAYIDFCR